MIVVNTTFELNRVGGWLMVGYVSGFNLSYMGQDGGWVL